MHISLSIQFSSALVKFPQTTTLGGSCGAALYCTAACPAAVAGATRPARPRGAPGQGSHHTPCRAQRGARGPTARIGAVAELLERANLVKGDSIDWVDIKFNSIIYPEICAL